MASLPMWKLKREVRRLGRQTRKLPGNVARRLLLTPYYDFYLARNVVTTPGERPETSKFAVFLIYPQFGVKPTHIRTLDHLIEKGYATTLISNLPLTGDDRAAVLPRCFRLIERPNFGYDFGGYRDGVLSLQDRLGKLDRLVLLNDSCWFPLPQDVDWLDEAEARDLDFVGATSHYGLLRRDQEVGANVEWNYGPRGRHFHYASYAVSIGPKILRNAGFTGFWKRFALSNEKNITVRRGEIGLTQWVLARRYSHASTLDIAHLDQDLRRLIGASCLKWQTIWFLQIANILNQSRESSFGGRTRCLPTR